VVAAALAAAGVAGAATLPNDPSFSLQWGLLNTGQTVNGVGGTSGADEDVVPAWSLTTGSRSIVVAVLDTGADASHPDLALNVWTNPGGVGGCPQGTHGFNIISGENACDVTDNDTSYNGHGTHVAGIIGATGNNGLGVAGVNWQTTILPVKWLDSADGFSNSRLVTALQKVLALKQAGIDIRVVNISPTSRGTAYSQQLSDAIAALGSAGILVVTAAGNSGENNDSIPRYPCDYSPANLICVTMTDSTDHLPGSANYGATTVDLAAPGSRIYSTRPVSMGSYGTITGGSMAAAEVSGAAALVLSQTPSLSLADLENALLDNVRPLSSLTGKVRTGGVLDVCAAMQGCSGGGPAPSPPVNSTPPTVSGTAQVGQVLTASTGSWQNSPTSYAYVWRRCVPGGACSSTGGTSSSYTVASADLGDVLIVTVTAANDAGAAASSSSPTAVVTQASGGTLGRVAKGTVLDSGYQGYKAASPFVMPAGQAGAAQSLSLWLNVSGSPVNARAMLYADSAGRPGALVAVSTDQTLPVGSSQLATFALPGGTTLQAGATYWLAVGLDSGGGSVGVWAEPRGTGQHVYNANPAASNPFGNATVASSAGDVDVSVTYSFAAPQQQQPPADVSPPTISGTPQVGGQLTATTGTWQNSPTSYTYLWSRCDPTGASCASTGSTGSTYALGSVDLGHTLRVAVTASNAAGSSGATSTPSAVVTSAAAATSFGTTTIGPSSDRFAANYKRVNSYTVSTSGSLTKLTIYLQPSGQTGSQTIRGLVYADAGGHPGALLATGVEVTFSSSQAAGWYDLTFTTPLALSPGTYWIGAATGSSNGVIGFRWKTVGNSRYLNTDTYSDGPSSPFGSGSFDSEEMSLYATVSAG
jgi:subtilisin family serine protease